MREQRHDHHAATRGTDGFRCRRAARIVDGLEQLRVDYAEIVRDDLLAVGDARPPGDS